MSALVKHGQLPIIVNHIITYDIDRFVVTANFKITVLRSKPAVYNFFDHDVAFAETKTPWQYFRLMTGVADYFDFQLATCISL